MRALVTGAEGFLGWHLSCRLRATRGIDAIRIGRHNFDEETVADALEGVDVVFHLAGVNRAPSEEAVESGNAAIAHALAAAIRGAGQSVHVVYANSVHARGDSSYGRGKATAARLLGEAVRDVEGSMTDMLLPNVFGENGRPGYNSFVATFAHAVATGGSPTVSADRAIELLHAQDAAESLIRAAESGSTGEMEPRGVTRAISDVLGQLREFKALYDRGDFPDLAEPFARDLFNTYRSYTFPEQWPLEAKVHDDSRGRLFETVRSHGGTGQAFVSTTVPGASRGDHYHLHKVERFFVLEGEADIQLRKLFSSEVVTFRVSGDRPVAVDMPTMWVHSIRNVGSSPLVTMFWADQLLDPANPDQYPEQVLAQEATNR